MLDLRLLENRKFNVPSCLKAALALSIVEDTQIRDAGISLLHTWRLSEHFRLAVVTDELGPDVGAFPVDHCNGVEDSCKLSPKILLVSWYALLNFGRSGASVRRVDGFLIGDCSFALLLVSVVMSSPEADPDYAVYAIS